MLSAIESLPRYNLESMMRFCHDKMKNNLAAIYHKNKGDDLCGNIQFHTFFYENF